MASVIEQVPGIQRRKFGDIVVTALNDGYIMLPPEALNDISAAEIEALYRAAGRRAPFATAINSYLVQTPDHMVMIDAGCGRFYGPLLGKTPKNLKAAGVRPEEIDLVVVSHMHPDHIGGLLTDEDRAEYPNARIMLAAEELAYWTDNANRAHSPPSTLDSFGIAQQLVKTYDGRIETFRGAPKIVPGITAVPLYGHTPGHTGFAIGMHAPELVIWADVSHAPEIQFKRPDLTVIFDVDPDQARVTRRAIIERAVDEDLMVAGMHIPFPGFIRIARSDDAYAFYPQVFQYELLE